MRINENYCTRPKLALRLMEAGFKGEIVNNIFNNKYKAWVFIETPELLQIVRFFYCEINSANGDTYGD